MLQLYTIILLILRLTLICCIEAPQVHIPDQGLIIGKYLKMFRTQTIKAFLGVQYARAGRFEPPELRILRGNGIVLNATTYGPDCWQKPAMQVNNISRIVHEMLRIDKSQRNDNNFDENCLYLNLYVPLGLPNKDGYAVVVWLHSGDFSYGRATDVDPFQLVLKQKVIVITLSFRLNIFGFLSTGDGEAPGNFGLMDQSAAFFWIRKNINHFGGNENQITIMGHSAGAISAGLHLTSRDWSRDAFTKAIIMSGNPIAEKSVRFPSEYHMALDTISSIFTCPRRPSSLFIHCLKRIDAKILAEHIPYIDWGPVVDYGLSNSSMPFIEDMPINLFNRGNMQNVPVILGITDMEDVLYISDETAANLGSTDFELILKNIAVGDLRSLMGNEMACSNFHIILDALKYMYDDNPSMPQTEEKLVQNVLNIHTDRLYMAPLFELAEILLKKNNVFVYVFKSRPKVEPLRLYDWIGVPKFFDLIYLWGIPYMETKNDTIPIRDWSMMDKKLTDIVMTLWANFFRSSNPTTSNIYIKWPSYGDINPTNNATSKVGKQKLYLEIDENFSLKISEKDYRILFWNKYYPNIVRFTAECCNLTNNAYTFTLNNFHGYNIQLSQYIFTYICNLSLLIFSSAIVISII